MRTITIKLTCIVPVKNDAENIRNFLTDYSRQHVKFHQLILIVSPCEDNTLEVIDEFDFPELDVCMTNQYGVGVARNIGIDLATGNYLTFMDADWRMLNNSVVENIIKHCKETCQITVLNEVERSYKGLRKYIYWKDKNVSFMLVKKKECPKWNEELGFGEDRVFMDKDLGHVPHYKIPDTEINLSRADGVMSVEKYFNRYVWYGRTMMTYLFKTKDVKTAIGFGLYLISVIPLLWFIPFIRGFISGMSSKEIEVCVGRGVIEIISAYGFAYGFIQWLLGSKIIGR